MAQPLNYQLSFGGEKIPEPAPVKKETLISGSTPDQIKLVSGIAQNWVTDYLKSENPEADVSSLGEINYNPNLPVFDNAFPAVNDQTDFKALGLEDENGKVTTKGEQYAELKQMGIITQFGGLSNHGKALLMSEDDALLPENIDIFRAREDIGMYKGDDVGVLKQIGDLSTELATGVQNIVVGAAQYGLGGLAQIGVISDENKAADIAGGVAAIDAFTTGMAKLPMMSEGIVDSLVTLVATQMADSEDIAMVQAQHRQDVLRKASLQADYSFLEQVSPVIDFLVDPFERVQPVIGGSIEGAKQTMGETNYAEFTQPVQAVSQFAPMLLQGPLVPLGLAIQPEMLAIHATQTGATKLWAAAAAPAARAAFRAGETAKIVRQLEVDASILNAQQSIAITKAEKASNLSASLSEKANTATFTGDVAGSKAAADVAARADALAKSSARYAENIGGRINNVNEQIAKFQNAYGVADRTLKIADTFRKWPTVVGTAAGWPIEWIGKGLIATRKGVDAVSARTDKIGGMIRLADKVSGLGVGAVGSVFNPMLAVPAAAKVIGKGILALGPVIKGVGSFTRVMGEAASERAASIPFWQKVANFENLNPTQRMLANGFSEFAVAGGYLKRVGSNYAKTYPAFLGLEYLHSGDLETAAKNAIAPTIVIGAPGALLGSAITGSRSDLRNLAHQDMLNFRSRMDTEQRQKFDSMDSGVKRVIANVAESQPGVKFDFTDTGRGRFEESTYTVFINPNSRSPLRPVVTHEFLHYITEAGGATNSINHLLFGNEIGTGGLLKSVDGVYDKDYLRFKDEYIKLQEQDDAARRRNGQEVKAQTMDDAYLGMEYFVETQVDRLLRISESGELSRLAGKTQLQRFASKKINELADSMMSRGAFLENLAMRMGSLRDNKGEYVMGNGILADGVRDMPEMRNLFNKLISETSGRRPNATKSMDARSTSKASQGREIPITDKNDPMIGSMYSDFVFDGNGVVKRDQYGNPERISNDRKKSQESIGLSVADLQAKRIQSGEALLPGELRYDPQAKEWVGEYLTPEQIDVIRNSGFFEQPFIDSLDLVNGAARRGQGEVVNLSYSAATKRNKRMGPSYFSGGVTLREISPIQVRINKAGGIYVKSVDVLQLRANINEVARSKDGARVYEGDVVAISNDVNAVMKLHANDQPTDAYFAKYGAEAQTRKKLINSVFGKTLIDKGINEFSSSAPRSVIKDFRIDRFGKSVLKKGTDGVQVNHKFVRINYLPEGPLRSNDAGDVVVGNPELKAKIEERNRKLGLPPSDGFADATKPADISPEDVNPIQTRNEAERLFADGKQLYAFNEMDGTPSLVTSLEMLQNYPVDSLGYVDNGAASQTRYLPEGDRLPNGYKSHHDETLLKSAWNGTELDLKRPFKASDSLPSLSMRTKWEEKPLVSKDTFDFTKKARVVFGKNKNGEDVTFKYDPNLLNPPNIVDFAQVYSGEQIQYTIADRMSAVDGDMGGALHLFLKNNDIVIVGPDGKEYVVGWGNNSATVGTKMRKKAKDGAKVLMVYLMGKEAHQSNTRTVRLFDTQLENSSMPSHMSNIARAYSYIPIKEMKHVSLVREVFKIDEAIKKAKELNKDSNYINKLEQRKKSASKEADKIKVSAYENELAGIFRKIKSSQTRLDNGNGKQSIIDANIQELSNFATSAKGKMLIKKTPSKFIYEMTRTFDGRKSAVSQISNLKLDDFNGLALSSATADMISADKNAIVAGIDLSDNQDFFMLYVGDDPKQISAMTASEKVAATKLKQNSDFVVHEAYDTLILSPHLGRRNLNSRMENALDAVPDSFKAVLDDRPSVKAQVGKKNAKGNLILSEDNLLNTVRDQQTVPLIYNPTK